MPYFLLSPITWGLLLALALGLCWSRLSRGWRIAGIGFVIVLLVACMPLGANALQWMLESAVPTQARCTADDRGPIVVLAGGFEREPRDADDFAAFTLDSWNRVRMATDLWHRRNAGELWIAGGGPYRERESVMLGRLARDWKVPVDALRIEAGSQTTWQSAFALAPALADRKARVVTSPAHRARALLAFRAAGIEACMQAEGSDVLPFAGAGYLLPQVSAIAKTENALYELAGMVWYRLRASMRARR